MDAEDQEYFAHVKNDLIAIARKVAKKGLSYRGYQVGCSMLLWRSEVSATAGHYGMRSAANVKPIQSGPKACAEQTLIALAQSEGWERVIAIIIAAEPQADDDTGKNAGYLYPCGNCRMLLRHMPQITDETIVVTVDNGKGDRHETTFGKILQFFKET